MSTPRMITQIQSREIAIHVAETQLRMKACYPVNSPKPTRRVHGEMLIHSRNQHIGQLDELDAAHQPQGLVTFGLRQVRRVDLEFIAGLLPHTFSQTQQYICP
jgi:hypothetical protein